MNTKHTPGPWHVRYPLRSSERPRIVTGDKQEIATVAKVNGGTDDLVYNCNARLIAAAPKLLAACLAQLSVIDGVNSFPAAAATTELRAAIAQATGDA